MSDKPNNTLSLSKNFKEKIESKDGKKVNTNVITIEKNKKYRSTEISTKNIKKEVKEVIVKKKPTTKSLHDNNNQKDLSNSEINRRLSVLKNTQDDDTSDKDAANQNVKLNIISTESAISTIPDSEPKISISVPEDKKSKGIEKNKIKTIKKLYTEEKLPKSKLAKSHLDGSIRKKKITVNTALNIDQEYDKGRSIAAIKRSIQKEKRKAQVEVEQKKIIREVIIPDCIRVQDLANRMAENSANVIKSLLDMGVTSTINDILDGDTAYLATQEMGHIPKRISEADVEIDLHEKDKDAILVERNPIVSVMGHVDHGKTSLLDALKNTNIAARESGGITQNTSCYTISYNNKNIVFIDTPGHQLFTSMRSRGAEISDIIILIIAADDSLMPQTIEIIEHIKKTSTPIIVAINKTDLPDVNINKVHTDLLKHNIITEAMGGDTLAIEISAKNKMNLDKLQEMILLQAELLEIKSNANTSADGIIVEVKIEKGKGVVVLLIIKNGTLKVGDVFVAGKEWGSIRAITNIQGKRIKEAQTGMPVYLLGFNGSPEAGDKLIVVKDESKAREVSEYRGRKIKDKLLKKQAVTAEDMFSDDNNKCLSIIIKSDTQGAIEAISTALTSIEHEDLNINIVHGNVGEISDSDILVAKNTNAIILGFGIKVNKKTKEGLKQNNIEFYCDSIIYNIIDHIKEKAIQLIGPKYKQNIVGTAKVIEIFDISKVGKIAGCMVSDGKMIKNNKANIIRNDEIVYTGSIINIKHFKQDVENVNAGSECGITLSQCKDLMAGDIIQCFKVEEIATKL